MHDIFQDYKRQKLLTKMGLLSLSVVLAISINTFMFTWESGNMLKASILETADTNSDTTDFFAQVSDSNIDYSSNKTMENITEFSYSLAYNPEEITLWELSSKISWEITEFWDTPWFATVLFTPSSPVTVSAGEILLQQEVKKATQDTTGIINIVNVNFSDTTWNIYQLTTQGIIF